MRTAKFYLDLFAKGATRPASDRQRYAAICRYYRNGQSYCDTAIKLTSSKRALQSAFSEAYQTALHEDEDTYCIPCATSHCDLVWILKSFHCDFLHLVAADVTLYRSFLFGYVFVSRKEIDRLPYDYKQLLLK